VKKIITILFFLYSSFILSQENKVNLFSTEHLELTKITGIVTNDNHTSILKQQIAEVQKQLKALDDLQNTVPKVAFNKQHFFTQKMISWECITFIIPLMLKCNYTKVILITMILCPHVQCLGQ
jgi:hypothetical protein